MSCYSTGRACSGVALLAHHMLLRTPTSDHGLTILVHADICLLHALELLIALVAVLFRALVAVLLLTRMLVLPLTLGSWDPMVPTLALCLHSWCLA